MGAMGMYVWPYVHTVCYAVCMAIPYIPTYIHTYIHTVWPYRHTGHTYGVAGMAHTAHTGGRGVVGGPPEGSWGHPAPWDFQSPKPAREGIRHMPEVRMESPQHKVDASGRQVTVYYSPNVGQRGVRRGSGPGRFPSAKAATQWQPCNPAHLRNCQWLVFRQWNEKKNGFLPADVQSSAHDAVLQSFRNPFRPPRVVQESPWGGGGRPSGFPAQPSPGRAGRGLAGIHAGQHHGVDGPVPHPTAQGPAAPPAQQFLQRGGGRRPRPLRPPPAEHAVRAVPRPGPRTRTFAAVSRSVM